MSEDALKQKLEGEFKQKGKVNLSSSDVGAFAKPDPADAGPVQGDVKVGADKKTEDPLMEAAEAGTPGKSINTRSNEYSGKQARVEPLADTAEEYTALEQLTITEEDREAFLDALVTGERYVRPFSIFGGKIKGKLRCRSQAESYAIMQVLSRETRDGGPITTALEYATRLRNMLIAAQVQELNGEEYATLQDPLLQTVKGSEVTPPGWLDQVAGWEAKNEAIISGLYNELKKFERRYWLMTDNADDQNFWRPEGSI